LKEEIRDVYVTMMCLPFLLFIQLVKLVAEKIVEEVKREK